MIEKRTCDAHKCNKKFWGNEGHKYCSTNCRTKVWHKKNRAKKKKALEEQIKNRVEEIDLEV